MIKIKFFCFLLIALKSVTVVAQTEEKTSSMDFVQIQNNNTLEALYYYKNNWKVLRLKALEKNYIDSYQILKNEYSEEAPFHLILVTTYKNESQFKAREKHFQELINTMGELNLLNDKKPSEFRRTLFGTDVKHLN